MIKKFFSYLNDISYIQRNVILFLGDLFSVFLSIVLSLLLFLPFSDVLGIVSGYVWAIGFVCVLKIVFFKFYGLYVFLWQIGRAHV